MVARCPHAGPALGTLLDRHLDRRRAPCFGTWGLSVPSSPWVCPGTVGIGSPTGGRPGFPRAAGQRVGPDFPGGSWREGRGAGTAQFPPGSAGSGWESRRPPASGGCFSKERPHVQRPFPSCSSSAAHGHGSVRRLALHRALVRLRTRRTSLRACKEETRADGKQTGRFTPSAELRGRPLRTRSLRRAAAGEREPSSVLSPSFQGRWASGREGEEEPWRSGSLRPATLFSGAGDGVWGPGRHPGVLVKSIRPSKQGSRTRPSRLKHDLGKNTKWRGFRAALFTQPREKPGKRGA